MERITACEPGELATRETEPQPATTPRPAKATSILLNPAAPQMPIASVEVIAPERTIPRAEPKVGKSIRLLDLALALFILLFVLPLMALCALAIRLSNPGPVIYRHSRIGRGGREFICFKFRTMSQSAEFSLDSLLVEGSPLQEEWSALYKLRSDPRVTFFGRFMRRYSLDELPQLFNIFRGDMSIVGPRPIVTDEIQRYGGHFDDYCRVKPGITGLWQVSGRHALSYDERVRLDAEYAANKSVGLDLLILWKTIPIVLLGQNE